MGRQLAASAAALACALTSCALTGCGGPDRAAPSATVRKPAPAATDSLLLSPEEVTQLVGWRLTVHGEHRQPNDEGSHITPDYCAAVSKTSIWAAPETGWISFHELDLDQNFTEQSKREHYSDGLVVDEIVVEYPDDASAAAAQSTVADSARRCAGQTIVIDYNGVPDPPWQFTLTGSDPTSASWDFSNAKMMWTCSDISKRRNALLLHVMACWFSDTQDMAAKIMDRILEDRA